MRSARVRPLLLATVFVLRTATAYAGTPLGYLTSAGTKTDSIVPLTWGLLILSCTVVVIVTALIAWAIFRHPRQDPSQAGETVTRSEGGVFYIYLGLAATFIALLVSVTWTMIVLANVASPPERPALNIEITGKQWWWDVRYKSDDPSKVFRTANEIHIPVGEPVQIELRSNDVIHSFWVPALTGKTDLIPGQTNTTWIEAKKAGTFSGQCAEFCGNEHAHMQILVVAQSPEAFQSWRADQTSPLDAPVSNKMAAARSVFVERCGACHAVRGTDAGGIFGPELSHLMQRKTLAAGTLPNRPGYLSAWVADPKHFKPGTKMPSVPLTSDELEKVRQFLRSLI